MAQSQEEKEAAAKAKADAAAAAAEQASRDAEQVKRVADDADARQPATAAGPQWESTTGKDGTVSARLKR